MIINRDNVIKLIKKTRCVFLSDLVTQYLWEVIYRDVTFKNMQNYTVPNTVPHGKQKW